MSGRRHPRANRACRQVRLAESQVAAVDACQCGAMQLHLGALTVRLTPDAMRELAETLDRALRASNRRPEAEPHPMN